MRSGRARPAWESFMGLPPRPSANWGAGPTLDRLRCAPGGRGHAGAPGKMRAPPAGRPQPAGGPEDSLPHPPGGLGPGGSAWARRAEAAASRARGGGRGGPGITWAEAGPRAPGGLSPESGRPQRERRRLLALSPSRAWAPSPTGMALTVDVAGPAPWGFRITGGRDFHTPIMVTKVAERGKAKDADLRPGDIIVAINGESAEGMLHAEAQSKIRQSPSPLRLQLDRSQAASPGQTNGDSSLEVLATRFQGSVRTHTESHSSLRSSYSSPTSLSPRAGSPFSPPPFSSPLAGEAAISRSFQSLACSPGLPAADRLSYSGRPGSRQAGLGRAGDSAVLVLPPSPGPRSSRPSPGKGPSFLAAAHPTVWTRKGEASSWTRTRKSSRCSRKIARVGRPPDSPAPFGSCRKPWRLRREEPGCAHPGGPVSPPRLLHLRRLWAEPEDAWALLGG
ncbi:PDZ and LIM domain protein 2 isoform X6 [Macaca fascicularis]|uniref:PDZ and LIM domain protein 2 isoform X6 n=1 Tax=Macaca fascicularis TaxID=9541 RepID=UPI003D15C123